MNSHTAFSVLRWLVRDTFRQALSSGVFWLMLGGSIVCVALCLTTTIRAPADAPAHLEMAFGIVQVPLDRGLPAAVRTVETYLAGWGADALGLLLALMWTAGFLPAFLEAETASVLLVKPLPRWSLLAGKCLSVVAFVAVQDALFLAGTWTALGSRTGIWNFTYLAYLPILLLHFTVFFSFSALLATATRSAVACVFGTILFWLLCWSMNLGRHWFVLVPDLQNAAGGLGPLLEFGYWILPKPLDGRLLFVDGSQADPLLPRLLDTRALAERGAWQPVASVLASCLCAVVLLALAGYDFVTAEY